MQLIRISTVTSRSEVITTINIILEESSQSGVYEMMKAENFYIYCSFSVSPADLSCFLVFQIRASIRTLNPKEEKYMQTEVKFKRQVFVRNVLRLKAIIMFFIDLGKFIQ